MQKSYLVKSPVHFADFAFFVKTGDILVHDTSNGNKLTVYRNGEVVKVVKQTTLGLAAMLKNTFIVEVTQTKATPKVPMKLPKKVEYSLPKPPIPKIEKPVEVKAKAAVAETKDEPLVEGKTV